jgi:uncharacterized membrane protein
MSAPALGLLARVPLLRALPEAMHRSLAESLVEIRFAGGERIFNRDDPGDRMYLIVEGEVEIDLPAGPGAERVVLRRLKSGDYFGELALLDGGGRTAGALAIAPARLLALSQTAFLSAVLGTADAAHQVMLELTARLRNTTTLLAGRASQDVVREVDAKLTASEKFAIRVATWNGSWAFILVVVLTTGGWMALNAIRAVSFDPYPYVFFNLVLAVAVMLQGPLLMMAQNRENQRERARAEVDYRVNLKNELAIEKIGQELAALHVELAALRRELHAKVTT